jgi:hypothetical protein
MFAPLIMRVRLNLWSAMSRMVAVVQFRDVRRCYELRIYLLRRNVRNLNFRRPCPFTPISISSIWRLQLIYLLHWQPGLKKKLNFLCPALYICIFRAVLRLKIHRLFAASSVFIVRHEFNFVNPLTPNDPYRGRTAKLTSKFAFYIFIQQI